MSLFDIFLLLLSHGIDCNVIFIGLMADDSLKTFESFMNEFINQISMLLEGRVVDGMPDDLRSVIGGHMESAFGFLRYYKVWMIPNGGKDCFIPPTGFFLSTTVFLSQEFFDDHRNLRDFNKLRVFLAFHLDNHEWWSIEVLFLVISCLFPESKGIGEVAISMADWKKTFDSSRRHHLSIEDRWSAFVSATSGIVS